MADRRSRFANGRTVIDLAQSIFDEKPDKRALGRTPLIHGAREQCVSFSTQPTADGRWIHGIPNFVRQPRSPFHALLAQDNPVNTGPGCTGAEPPALLSRSQRSWRPRDTAGTLATPNCFLIVKLVYVNCLKKTSSRYTRKLLT